MKILLEDRLKGGVDVKDLGKYLKRFDPKEVKMGVKDEKEHTKDPKIAAEIASDHLSSSPHYYSRLKAAHIESTDVFEFNFHDILEGEDDPIGLIPTSSYTLKKTEPKKITPKEKVPRRKGLTRAPGQIARDVERVSKRETLQADLTRKNAQPYEIEAALKVFDFSKDKGGTVHGLRKPARPPMGDLARSLGKAARFNPFKDVSFGKTKPVQVSTDSFGLKSKKTDPKYSGTRQ
jgi:hypothetical protein